MALPRRRSRSIHQTACPAPFEGAGNGPKEGSNEGFSAGGQTRKFQLLLPPTSFTGPRPILFAFHGTTENGPKFVSRAKLTDFVANGFIVVAPDAAGNGTFWPVWDAMRSPGTESAANPDVELFDRLLDPYELAPLPDMTCGSTARAGCREACQLFADCAVENRTVGPSLQNELADIGFTTSSCAGCVQSCQSGATAQADTGVLSCFAQKQAAATCGPGIEGAIPLFLAINECCAGKSGSNLCVSLCTTLNGNSAAKAFLPTCQQLAQ